MSMAQVVLPGQPLSEYASASPGKGAFAREGTVFSSRVGALAKSGNAVGVQANEDRSAIPETGSTVLGSVTRLARTQAVLTIISVDGRPCQQDWQGIIRTADIRQTEKDKIKIWDCFRPGDVVRATVISLGDVRSYYLSTARNDLGVVFAKHSETGNRLVPVSWQEMQDPISGLSEPRKVAGPADE